MILKIQDFIIVVFLIQDYIFIYNEFLSHGYKVEVVKQIESTIVKQIEKHRNHLMLCEEKLLGFILRQHILVMNRMKIPREVGMVYHHHHHHHQMYRNILFVLMKFPKQFAIVAVQPLLEKLYLIV